MLRENRAELYANDLFDELISSGILDDKDIWCGQTDNAINMKTSPRADHNFILWSLIPYIAACSGENLMNDTVKFKEVATIRPDGGNNIFHAAVVDDNIVLPEDYIYMKKWCGPMWNEVGDVKFWQINGEWSDRSYPDTHYSSDIERLISMYKNEQEEWTWLCENGYAKVCGDLNGSFKASWQIVQLASNDVEKRLFDIGKRIKEKYESRFDELKAPYAKAVLDSIPPHLRRVKEYELQFLFHSDGWFLLHCIVCLLKNGKLKEPTEGQRKALSTIIRINADVSY